MGEIKRAWRREERSGGGERTEKMLTTHTHAHMYNKNAIPISGFNAS